MTLLPFNEARTPFALKAIRGQRARFAGRGGESCRGAKVTCRVRVRFNGEDPKYAVPALFRLRR